MSQGRKASKCTPRRLAGPCVALLVIAALGGAISISRIAGLLQAGPTLQPLLFSMVAMANMTACVAAAIRGLRLPRRYRGNTRPLVNDCQVLALVAAGTGIANWIVDGLVLTHPPILSATVLAVTLVLLAWYWHIVATLSHATLWEGLRDGMVAHAFPVHAKVCHHLTLDPLSGTLRPTRVGEVDAVTVMALDEYLEQVPGRVAQQVARSASAPSHCSCATLGKATFGNVFIPTEAQAAAGFSAGVDIGFAYYLTHERLTLVMDDSIDSTAQALLALYLGDQYLEKREPAAVLYELFDLLLHDASTWLKDCERRLEELEDSLIDDVRELPRDFSEYVGSSRRHLGVLMGFYKQAGDMFEDLADPAGAHFDVETSQLLQALANRSHRLAADVAALREYTAEIRVGYQERIEVRRNNVIAMLTIVTTIFTPLSLVTSWYGMNFVNMPELTSPDAYYVMVATMVVAITAEVAYFKRKNWF